MALDVVINLIKCGITVQEVKIYTPKRICRNVKNVKNGALILANLTQVMSNLRKSEV